jgi:hypothetical protein
MLVSSRGLLRGVGGRVAERRLRTKDEGLMTDDDGRQTTDDRYLGKMDVEEMGERVTR